jgi:hypothetical protein
VPLHTSKQESEDIRFEQKEFMSHKEIAAEEDITKTPEYGNAKIGDKKPVLSLPWAVIKENKK